MSMTLEEFKACDGCTNEMCHLFGECITAVFEEAEREEREYIERGVCSQCGATCVKEAAKRCKPNQEPSGEWHCAGEKLWPEAGQ